MIDATRTTTVLLQGLFDSENEAVWSEFDARYRPILVAFARRLGLGEADAADVAQETLLEFIGAYRGGRYDRERGRLRSWLIGIARTRVAAIRRFRAGRREVRGASALLDLDDEAGMTRVWDAERRGVILREAMHELRAGTRLRDETINVFEMLVVHQMPVAAVAEEMGI